MKFYNTLGRKLQEFNPIKSGRVNLYTCGPTVYDFAHLGNLRSFVFDDSLRRTIAAHGYDVKHVMNITDVGHLVSDADEGEDKLEKGSQREGRSVWDVASFYISAFEEDMRQLNILPPNAYVGPNGVYARATDFIKEQVELIQILIDKNFAYKTKQAIYFDISKLPDYGKLTGQKLEDKETAARSEVVTDKNKHHPQDFALWFFKTGRFVNHSMSWPSPWGEGFPGWHLECSAIIHATLGEPLDIHTGGVDHIGTHHTNEIAQSEAAFGVELAKFWLHNEHLLVESQKMAKSAGNFYTLKSVKDRGYDTLALRLLFLQSHYRSQSNFTWDALDASQVFLNRLYAWADLKYQPNAHQTKIPKDKYTAAIEKMKQAIANDLSTAQALSILSSIVTETEETGINGSSFQNLLDEADKLFGLDLGKREDIEPGLKELINQREEVRQSEDWHMSDKIRQRLLHRGIEVNDTPAGPIWRRV